MIGSSRIVNDARSSPGHESNTQCYYETPGKQFLPPEVYVGAVSSHPTAYTRLCELSIINVKINVFEWFLLAVVRAWCIPLAFGA